MITQDELTRRIHAIARDHPKNPEVKDMRRKLDWLRFDQNELVVLETGVRILEEKFAKKGDSS